MDIELLNNTIQKLLSGEKVEIPKFNFAKGIKEYEGKYLYYSKRVAL